MDFPIVAQAAPSPYFLRGLLHCHICDKLLIPAFSSNGRRLYNCPGRQCPRPCVSAEQIEEQVWSQVTAHHAAGVRNVAPDGRQEALVALISRVTVGDPASHLEYDWRN